MYRHWKLQKDSNQILWVTLDVENERVNSLSDIVLSEFIQLLDEVDKETEKTIAMVIRSEKTSGFIAGADVRLFSKFENSERALDFIRLGHQACDRLASFKIPTIAMIHGFCLGGGLELALACRYRIALADPKTRLGLPEVMLGIHPGWGGTVRLPRLIGALNAFDLILTGRTIRAEQAKKIGLVDEVVPVRQFETAVKHYALTLPKPYCPTHFQMGTNLSFFRPLLGWFMNRKLAASVDRDHYPAPYAALENWVRFGVDGSLPMKMEIESMGHLFHTQACKNLLRVFHLQEKLKSCAESIERPTFRHVHVVGAGTMGAEIAAWCAGQGLRVTLFDTNPERLASAKRQAEKMFEHVFKTSHERQAASDRWIPDLNHSGVEKADVIIEAIFENLEAKQNLFLDLEKRARPDCLLATNTSSIPLEEIASILKDPNRLIGIHFFNPVSKMKLVEVVKTKNTPEEQVACGCHFVRAIDRLPLPVLSSPGFLVNRLLMPYLMESVTLLDEGVPPEVIDRSAKQFGMPMGPIELADTVGLDICLSVAENLSSHFGGTVSSRLKQMVAQGKLGKKSGQGFYQYKKGKIQKNKAISSAAILSSDITDRLMLRLIRESLLVLKEGVVEHADFLDAGMIFGTGFAPFRGGPMHYFEQEGAQKIAERMNQLSHRYGDRFAWVPEFSLT